MTSKKWQKVLMYLLKLMLDLTCLWYTFHIPYNPIENDEKDDPEKKFCTTKTMILQL